MNTRDPRVDDAFLCLEDGLTLRAMARGEPVQPAYFREVCASTRVMRLGDVEMLVTITVHDTRSRPPRSGSGSGGIPLM
jgi:hypothetical protein